MLFSGVFIPTVYPELRGEPRSVYTERGPAAPILPGSANQNHRRSSVLSIFRFHFSIFHSPVSYLDLCPFARLSREESTLMKHPISVADKELTGSLSPLDSALTKNRGVGVIMVNQTSHEASLSRVRRGGAAEGYENCRVYTNSSHSGLPRGSLKGSARAPRGTPSTAPVQASTLFRAASARSASPRYPFPTFASQLSTLNCQLLTLRPAQGTTPLRAASAHSRVSALSFSALRLSTFNFELSTVNSPASPRDHSSPRCLCVLRVSALSFSALRFSTLNFELSTVNSPLLRYTGVLHHRSIS
jgi:hypothetical protein